MILDIMILRNGLPIFTINLDNEKGISKDKKKFTIISGFFSAIDSFIESIDNLGEVSEIQMSTNTYFTFKKVQIQDGLLMFICAADDETPKYYRFKIIDEISDKFIETYRETLTEDWRGNIEVYNDFSEVVMHILDNYLSYSDEYERMKIKKTQELFENTIPKNIGIFKKINPIAASADSEQDTGLKADIQKDNVPQTVVNNSIISDLNPDGFSDCPEYADGMVISTDESIKMHNSPTVSASLKNPLTIRIKKILTNNMDKTRLIQFPHGGRGRSRDSFNGMRGFTDHSTDDDKEISDAAKKFMKSAQRVAMLKKLQDFYKERMMSNEAGQDLVKDAKSFISPIKRSEWDDVFMGNTEKDYRTIYKGRSGQNGNGTYGANHGSGGNMRDNLNNGMLNMQERRLKFDGSSYRGRFTNNNYIEQINRMQIMDTDAGMYPTYTSFMENAPIPGYGGEVMADIPIPSEPSFTRKVPYMHGFQNPMGGRFEGDFPNGRINTVQGGTAALSGTYSGVLHSMKKDGDAFDDDLMNGIATDLKNLKIDDGVGLSPLAAMRVNTLKNLKTDIFHRIPKKNRINVHDFNRKIRSEIERKIFFLINGRNSIKFIAEYLGLDKKVVFDICMHLFKERLVEI